MMYPVKEFLQVDIYHPLVPLTDIRLSLDNCLVCILPWRAQKLTRLAAEVDMLRMFIRLAADIKVLPLKKVVPLQERLDEIGRMLGGWIKSVRQR